MSDFIDLSELNTLVAELDAAAGKGWDGARRAVAKGALNVKNDARRFASGIAHAPQYPQSIGYDIRELAGSVEAKIGPDKDKPQGALGNILEYGTSKNAPITHLAPALDREGPRFEQAIADVADRLL